MSSPPEADLRRLYDRAPVGFYRSTVDGRFIYVNPALVRMLGYERADDVLALHIGDDVYVDAKDRARLIAEYSARGLVDGVAVRWRTKSGAPLDVRLYGYAVDDGFEVTAVDVTAEQAARARADYTDAALQLLIDQVPAIITIADRDLRISSSRGSGLRALGLTSADVTGRTLPEIVGDGDPILDTMRAALAGETRPFEYTMNGRVLAGQIAPLRSEDGASIVGTVSIAVDVTEGRKLETRIQTAQRAESVGVLAGGVAHDFNNLLVAMLGNADLALLELEPGTDARYAVESIRTAALRAAELTEKLLAVAGRRMSAATCVELRPLIDELLVLLRPTFRADVHVDLAVAGDAHAVKADPTQLRQVLLNLIANAREALKSGGRISVRARALVHDGRPHDDDVLSAPAGEYVVIEVADDGAGMDDATRRRVFEPFFTTKQHGHGLGLAAVLGIVRGHGGAIRLRSAPGGGSSFQIFWPAAVRVRERGAHVLVVDDEAMVREVVCRMLGEVGYVTCAADDGASALARVRAGEPIDAIVLDLTMPGMSGGEVLATLRRERPALPVIVCSGQDRDRADVEGAAAVLSKPFHFDELVAAIEAAIAR